MSLLILLDNSSSITRPIKSVILILYSHLRPPSNKEEKKIIAKVEAKAEGTLIVIVYSLLLEFIIAIMLGFWGLYLSELPK